MSRTVSDIRPNGASEIVEHGHGKSTGRMGFPHIMYKTGSLRHATSICILHTGGVVPKGLGVPTWTKFICRTFRRNFKPIEFTTSLR